MKFQRKTLRLTELLLDPNNFRFLDNPNFKKRVVNRFHNQSVQDATLRLLEKGHNYQLKPLRNSILSNGYIVLEKIIVTPYKYQDGKYLVIEGNRRVAVLKMLLKDHKEGVINLTTDQIKNFSRIPGAILEPENLSFDDAERIIMGIRHIAGPREWGAYQQAQLIYELIEEQGKDFDEIANYLGLNRVEVGRRYRAIKALHTMEEDEEYAESALPEYYRLFHELISLPNIRERFGWKQENCVFENKNKAKEFFELIAPQDPDLEPKLKTYNDVRKLKKIIGHDSAEESLFDPDQSLSDAISKIKHSDDFKDSMVYIEKDITQFENALNNISIDNLRGLSQEDILRLESIIELIQSRIEDYKKLML